MSRSYRKIVIEKSVAEEIKKKLESYKQVKNEEKDNINDEFAENPQKSDLYSENKQVSVKLQGSECVEKSHLYSDKYWVAGKGKKGGYWEYVYNKNNRIDKTLKKTNEKPLTIVYDKTQDNFTQSLQILSQAFDYIDNWVDDWSDPKNASKSICKELRGKKICFNDISYEHIAISGSHSKASKKNGKNLREPKNLLNHVPYLPIAKKSLEDEGLWTQARYEPLIKRKLDKTNGKVIKGYVYQTLSVELPKGSVHKYVQTTVSKIKYVDNSYSDTVYISVVGKDSIKTGEKTIKKSLANELDFITKGKTTSIRASSYDPGSTRQAFTNLIIPQLNNLSSRNVTKSLTISDKLFRLWQRRLSPELQKEMKKYVDEHSRVFSLFSSYKDVYDIKGYPKGLDLENNILMELADTYFVVSCGGDWQDEKLVKFSIGEDDKLKAEVVDKCDKEDKRVLNKKLAYIINPSEITKSLTYSGYKLQGSKIHKSFNVEVTDITENNKNQKVEQLQKALYALYEQKPFVINHISTENDKSKRYNDVILKINNFNKDKIEKAVHSVAMTLDTSVKTSKGEPFMFKSQEDLTNRIISQFLKTTRKLYLFIIKYFDLPEIDVMTKSTMIWKGKIIYNPETGKPLTNIEWNKFVKALDDFVNRNYKGIGDRIVLSSETLGRILDRMAKYNTLKNITELKLEDIKYSGKTFDWISESVKNLKNTFGESLDRTQTARIEVMQQSATQYITNIEDQLKNKIKQTLIDGIKNRESKTQVSQNLFNNCVGINRDFQRWADSEVQAATTKAYINEEIYNTPEETNIYFKRREIVDDNTCKKCKDINGIVVKYSRVPLTDEHIKDDFAKYAIWDGKTTGHIPETIQHPYCRGCWLRYYPMKNPIVDALSTIKEKNNNKWDKAVEQAKKEFEDKGIKNPNDKTKGYVARIREIYNEK